MFLHIGNNVLLRKDEIIGVFSIESLLKDPKGKKFMNEVRQKKTVKDISEGKWASIIITDDSVYISRISSITLMGRSDADMQELLSTTEQRETKAESEINTRRTMEIHEEALNSVKEEK